MAPTCTGAAASPDAQQIQDAGQTVGAPVEALREIVRRYGTPTYAYDIGRVRAQVGKLRTHLPAAVEILYSLKANASLGLCGVLAGCGLGADVASAGELAIALAAGFPPDRIFLTGPDRSPAVLAHLRKLPEIVVSVDSVSELRLLVLEELQNRALVRLRPDFTSYATCSAGPDSRFGLTWDDLPACRALLPSPGTPGEGPGVRAARPVAGCAALTPNPSPGVPGEGGNAGINVIGFHVFSGSQILAPEGIIHHFRGGVNLALRAADALGVAPEFIDLGGGLGIPYAPLDREVDLDIIGAELHSLAQRVAPARLVLELGRYPVAQAGWYLTTVLAEQTHRGRPAVVVDGGTHQRGDMCGLGLRLKGFAPVVIPRDPGAIPAGGAAKCVPTDILGCLSLPSDVPAENRLMPALAPGDVLAFPNAGAYGLAASPWLFHSHPAPAEVAFDGTSIQPLRPRQPPESVLEGQVLLQGSGVRS